HPGRQTGSRSRRSYWPPCRQPRAGDGHRRVLGGNCPDTRDTTTGGKKNLTPPSSARKPDVASPESRLREMPNPHSCNGGKAAIGRRPPKGTASMPKLYEALAEAFLAEGVDTQF